MKSNPGRNLKAQSVIELSFVIIMMVLFLGGIINIWVWSNNQIVARQLAYNASRVAAGSSSDTYKLQWPVYSPPALAEDKVILNGPLENY